MSPKGSSKVAVTNLAVCYISYLYMQSWTSLFLVAYVMHTLDNCETDLAVCECVYSIVLSPVCILFASREMFYYLLPLSL